VRSVNQNREYSIMISRIQRFVILANGYTIQNVSSKKDAQIVNRIVLIGLSAGCSFLFLFYNERVKGRGFKCHFLDTKSRLYSPEMLLYNRIIL